MKTHLSLKAFVAFDAVARHLSITKAAKELNMTQGAVSKQIINLEYQLGVQLLRRDIRPMRLTEQGEAFRPKVHEAIQLLDEATHQMRAKKEQLPLEIIVPPTLAMRWLIPRLPAFRENHPDIDIRIRTNLASRFSEYKAHANRATLAIVLMGENEGEGLAMSEYLMAHDGVVICTSRIARTLRSPDDLRNHTLLHAETFRAAWTLWLKSAGVDSIDPSKGSYFDFYPFVLQAAADGVGVAVAPYPLVEGDIRSGRLTIPFPTIARSQLAYYVVAQKYDPTDYAAKTFHTWLRETAAPVRNPDLYF